MCVSCRLFSFLFFFVLCVLHGVYGSLCVAGCSLFVDCCLMFGVRCVLCVVCCLV